METDDLLVRRVLAGDKPAFGELIDRHRREALRLARYLLRHAHDAEDVVQEAFLHAFLDLRELRAHDRFVAWLLGMVVYLAKTRLGAGRRRPAEACPAGAAPSGS